MKKSADKNDAMHRTRKVRKHFKAMMGELRNEVEKIVEPQARALLETSAEVLGGLAKALKDYETKREKAWKTAR
jgi:hypothetical protein